MLRKKSQGRMSGKGENPSQESIKSNKWETAPQRLRQPRAKEQGNGGGVESRYRRQKEKQIKQGHRLDSAGRKMPDDVFALAATEPLDTTSRGNAGFCHELSRLRLADPGDGDQQADYGDAPVFGVGRRLLKADGPLANKIEQGLALPAGGSGLLQVLTALFIGQYGQGVGGIGHRITHFRHRTGLHIAQGSARR